MVINVPLLLESQTSAASDGSSCTCGEEAKVVEEQGQEPGTLPRAYRACRLRPDSDPFYRRPEPRPRRSSEVEEKCLKVKETH